MYQSNNVTMMQKMIGKLLHCFIGTLLNFYSKN